LLVAGPIVQWMHPEDTDKFRRFEDLVYRIAHDRKKEEVDEAKVSELKPPSDPPEETSEEPQT
jgi:hypothetical protein